MSCGRCTRQPPARGGIQVPGTRSWTVARPGSTASICWSTSSICVPRPAQQALIRAFCAMRVRDNEDLPLAGTDYVTTKTCHQQALTRACLRYNTIISLEIGPGCTEKPNYLDSGYDTKSSLGSTHDNGIDSIGSIHGEIETARPFSGPANLCCQPTTTSSKNLILNHLLSVFESLLNLCLEFFQRDVSMGCVTPHPLSRCHVFSWSSQRRAETWEHSQSM